jgi:hypothetical protein
VDVKTPTVHTVPVLILHLAMLMTGRRVSRISQWLSCHEKDIFRLEDMLPLQK